jgi:hypothetical protein
MSNNAIEQQLAIKQESDRERLNEQYQRRKAEGRCVRCGDPLGAGDTAVLHRACADKQNEYQRAVVAAGNCAGCHEPRGENGTERHCRRCAKKANAAAAKVKARLRREGNCVSCRKPRGEKGNSERCEPCAKKKAAGRRSWGHRLMDEGRCVIHGEMIPLEKCPACLYEEGKIISLRDFTFDGLIPPLMSGDKLEVCVGCKKCRQSYCKGQSYYRPILPRYLKFRDEHVGEKDSGLWLRFSGEDEQGQVEIEYEVCSLPNDKCVRWASKKRALEFLSWHRAGKKLFPACEKHVYDRPRLKEATTSRLQQQIEASAQSQNGNGQEKGEEIKIGSSGKVGRPRKFTDQQALDAMDTLDSRVSVSALARKLQCTRAPINDWVHDQGYPSLDKFVEARRRERV